MASERKIKLTLDGEKEFKSALNSINLQTKALNSEMKAVTSTFDKNTTAEEKNRKTSELLRKTQKSYQEQIDKLKDRIAERTEKFGENSDYVNKLKAQMFNAEAAMNNLTKGFEESADAAEDASEGTLKFSDVLSANLLAGVIQKGLEALASKLVEIGKAMIELGFNAASLADELNTLSATTNLSTQTLQELRYAAAFVDVEESTLTGSLSKLTKTMYSASTGSRSARKAFKDLGINIYNADGSLRSSYDVFLEMIDALGQIDDEVTRDGVAMSVFGKSRQQLNPLINAGSEALNAYAQEAQNVGYVLDQDTLDALNSVNDEVDRMKLQWEALKNQLGADVAPVLHELIQVLKDVVAAVDWEVVGQIVYAALMVVVGAFQRAVVIVQTTIKVFKWLGDVFEKMPETVSKMTKNLKDKFNEIKDIVKGKFTEMIENAKNWGKDMIDGFINGIKSKIGELTSAVSGLAGNVAGYLHFSSPDVGPLKDYETWMPDMVEGLARSLQSSSYKLENAAAGLAGGVAAGMTMNLGGITINGVADNAQIDRMVNQIERKLGRRLYR